MCAELNNIIHKFIMSIRVMNYLKIILVVIQKYIPMKQENPVNFIFDPSYF